MGRKDLANVTGFTCCVLKSSITSEEVSPLRLTYTDVPEVISWVSTTHKRWHTKWEKMLQKQSSGQSKNINSLYMHQPLTLCYGQGVDISREDFTEHIKALNTRRKIQSVHWQSKTPIINIVTSTEENLQCYKEQDFIRCSLRNLILENKEFLTGSFQH